MKNLLRAILVALGIVASSLAQANWNSDWASRVKITINTDADGAGTKTEVDGTQVLVRLHTGNFAFTDAKPDGSDIRFIADDDKTPLKFHIEQYDSVTELGFIWVTVPKILGSNKTQSFWMYYNNPKAPPASDSKTTYDVAQAIVFHLNDKDGPPKDATAYGNNAQDSGAHPNPSGLIAGDVTLDGSGKISVPASPSIKIGGNGITASMWIKPDGTAQDAVLFQQVDGANMVALFLKGDKLIGQVNSTATAPGGTVTAGAWHHVAVVGKDNLTVYLDGQQVGQAAVAAPGISGSVAIGSGFKGELEEFELAYTARSADWIQLESAGQGVDQKLVTYGTAEGGDDSSPSYFKILLGSVTPDGWVVIGILMIMMVISFTVMITKALFVTRTTKANLAFKRAFDALSADLTTLADARSQSAAAKKGDPSSMFRIYAVGTNELRKRFAVYKEKGRALILTPQSIDAIKASLDASLMRELQKLNGQMVLLTIAIAGGPFLGLLGTVVGVMITFAAIAAAGDVNVNSIAPGIAAALVATVAGLGVAIPSLFGYNYLASKIKELTTDMQVFVDEFVTRLAENYSE